MSDVEAQMERFDDLLASVNACQRMHPETVSRKG